jgi:hypothetical protein
MRLTLANPKTSKAHTMSLNVAIIAKEGIVLAADKKILRGDENGYYTSEARKIVPLLRNRAAVGVSGTAVTFDLLSRAEQEGIPLYEPGNLEELVMACSKSFRTYYEKTFPGQPPKERPDATFLICGFRQLRDPARTEARIDVLPSADNFYPLHGRSIGFEAAGVPYHGAAYLLHLICGQEQWPGPPRLSISRAINLAVFSIGAVARDDPRVGKGIDVLVLKEGQEAFFVNSQEIEALKPQHHQLIEQIRSFFEE